MLKGEEESVNYTSRWLSSSVTSNTLCVVWGSLVFFRLSLLIFPRSVYRMAGSVTVMDVKQMMCCVVDVINMGGSYIIAARFSSF